MRVLIISVNVSMLLIQMIEESDRILIISNLDLHLPQEIVPATLKKSARPAAPRRACKYYCIKGENWCIKCSCVIIVGGEGRENRGPRGDRGDYRRKEGANGDFKPEFRGGLGKLYWI